MSEQKGGVLIFFNSLTLMISSCIAAGFGFLFWVIAAGYYSEEDIGIATSAISAIGIITLLARFGIDQSMMRAMSQDNRGRIFTTTIALTTISTIVLSILFLINLNIWAPELQGLRGQPWVFIVVAVSSCAFIVLGNALLALRMPKVHLYQNIIAGARLLFLPFLVGAGAIGILLSAGIGYTLPIIILLLFSHSIIRLNGIDLGWARDTIINSLSFYINTIFTQIPALIMPLLVLSALGAEATAHYYMPYSIASIIFMIPVAIGTTLFIEISHGENIRASIHRAIKTAFLILTPAIIAVALFGSFALSLLGQGYAENGIELLYLLTLSSIGYGLVTIYTSVLRSLGLNRPLVLIGFALFILLVGLSALFISWFGLNGIGLAWIISHAIILLLILLHWNHIKIE